MVSFAHGSAGVDGILGVQAEQDRELERRRANGEIACAECRRQKLKCDKKLPCSSCVRRGCDSVCPNGILTARHGTRAKSESLQKKVLQMSKRIRQLEDAVQILQAHLSSEPHPLLAQELLDIKNVDEIDVSEKGHGKSEVEMYSDFGTLTISEQGKTHFVGRSGAEALLATVVNDDAEEVKERALAKLPHEIVYLADTFPFSPVRPPKDRVMAIIETRLPPYERATALVEAYLQHASCLFRPVEREQIMEELLPRFYKRRGSPLSLNGDPEIVAHQLALLLGVFACGAAGDLTLEACNEEGETYRQLARSALSLRSIFEGTSLTTVQAVALIGAYDMYNAGSQTIESAYKLHSLAMCLGVSIGLHWDPTNWGVELKYIQRRRSLFWELYATEILKSLGSGRPPMLRADEINCRFPESFDADAKQGERDDFWRWKFDFVNKIGSMVSREMCAVRPIKYSEILELDRKVREYSFMKADILSRPEIPYTNFSLQSLFKSVSAEAALLFIHRNFFIRSLCENPTDPLKSRFASSFLAAYSSAITILKLIRRDYSCSNHLLIRQWTLWVISLASAVVVGSIAATSSLRDFSRTALKELDLAIDLFKNASMHPVARNGLPILIRLREKATNDKDGLPRVVPPASSRTQEVDEALSMIGATKNVVNEERRPQNSSSSGTSSSSPSETPDARNFSETNMHRTLVSHERTTNPSLTMDTVGEPSSERHPQGTQSHSIYDTSSYHLDGSNKVEHRNDLSDQQFPNYTGSGGPPEWESRLPRAFHTLPPQTLAEMCTPEVGQDPTSISRCELPHVSSSTDRLREYTQLGFGPTGFPMNVDVSGNDFDVRGISNMTYFADPAMSSRVSCDEDATIEDAWRNIIEDARLSTSGLNNQVYY